MTLKLIEDFRRATALGPAMSVDPLENPQTAAEKYAEQYPGANAYAVHCKAGRPGDFRIPVIQLYVQI